MERYYSKEFLKQMKLYDKKLQSQIVEAIKTIPEGDILKLHGINTDPPSYRLRVRKYRVLFRMDKEKNILFIDKVDSRGDIYK